MSKSYIIIIVLAVIITIIILLTVLTARRSARNIYAWETSSLEDALRYGLENGEFDSSLVNLPKEEFSVPTPYGYRIAGFYIPGPENASRTILLSHGVTSNRWGMMKYAPIFIRAGWNIAILDHRKHGKSGGEIISYGVFETKDMYEVVNAVYNRFPSTEVFGLYGESMGSAIALQYAPSDERVSFVVADCPFDDFAAELRHRSGDFQVPDFIRNILLNLTMNFIESAAEYDPRSIRPIDSIMDTDIPILFNHGGDDDYVPTIMSVRMYEARKDFAPTDLNIYPDSRHASSIIDHRFDYENDLKEWFKQRLDIVL